MRAYTIIYRLLGCTFLDKIDINEQVPAITILNTSFFRTGVSSIALPSVPHQQEDGLGSTQCDSSRLVRMPLAIHLQAA